MRAFCPTCKQDTEPQIDTDTLVNKSLHKDTKAICPTCKSPLALTSFALKSLFSMKRLFTAKPTRAFQYKCSGCKDFTDAVLSKDEKQALCAICGSVFNLTTFTITALKLSKGKQTESIEEDLQQAKNRLENKSVGPK